MAITKTNYKMMDVVKFLSAILLVCAHTASERVKLPGVLDLFCSLYIITVPFFFIASSFLFFRKLEMINDISRKSAYLKYTKRIGSIYLAWSLIYFCFVAVTWIQTDASADTIFSWIHGAFVYTTYSTIWFLPALWVAVSLVYILRYKMKCSTTLVFTLALVLYLVGAIEYSYHSLLSITETINDSYISVMRSWRNGIFNGFVYAAIGLLTCCKQKNIKLKYSIVGTCLFCIAFLAEAFLMKRIVPAADMNFLFMLVPFSYFFFSMICLIQLPDSKIYVPLRKMSMLIFVSQRLFLTAIPSIIGSGYIDGPWDITDNGIIGMLLVVLEVCIFSYIIMKSSEKVKILKYLM